VLRKQDLQLMMNMAGGSSATNGSKSNVSNPTIQETSETKVINGYRATKVIITEPDSNTEYHAWFTKQIHINPGMLAESWMNMIPVRDLMPKTNLVEEMGTPVHMKMFRNGNL